MSDNLPLVMRAGGEVAEVLSWSQHQNITDVAKNAIARFVINNPEFAHSVDLLADIVSFHGVDFDADIRRFVREHGADVVHLANQYLYEIGRLSNTEHDFDDIEYAIAALANLRDAGVELADAEQVDRCLYRLGGFEAVSHMSVAEINFLLRAV